MNIDYKKNGENKSFFFANPKHQYHLSQCAEHDCSAHNEKNGDYKEYLKLSHFMDKH